MRASILAGVLLLLTALGGAGCRDSDKLVSVGRPRAAGPEPTPPLPEPQPAPTPPPPPAETPQDTDGPPPLPDNLDRTPAPTPDGVPGPMPGVYTDLGPAPNTDVIRGLVALPIRNKAELERTLRELYDPDSPRFRRYMTPQEWNARHAPWEQDVKLVSDHLESVGLKVERVATNRLLIHFTGTVSQFNEAFGVQLIVLERKSPQGGNDPHNVYGLPPNTEIKAPQFVKERIASIVAVDLPTDPGPLPGEFGEVPTAQPQPLNAALTPQQVASAYGLTPLYQRGIRGRGVKLGVTIGAGFRWRDLRAFWKIFGIERADPTVVQTMEPPGTRYREGQLDIEWASVMAPEADIVVYMGPDARNTSMIYTFNEAIARGEVSVITDSFAHREDSEPRAVHEQYSASAMMAAALGITVIAAGGDSAGVDVPSSSPYVTSVGGTQLRMNGNTVAAEVAWLYSGSGISMTFPTPEWQQGLPQVPRRRAVADVALNADTGYWYTWLGNTVPNTGTSFGSPIMAGLIAVVNSARATQNKPAVGWLNSQLYTRPDVQATFRDITQGVTDRQYAAGPGWDIPTGWGAPNAQGLFNTLP
ncbi:protease pro-enzyme activation domain-containing protein [Myxococcus sp. RHSTA-1-4]|uniref:S53 family peptidase n=1 Tax=Myxococcus sp. RHSTA-1-4 TaxID=2874601 RepID=UPI001CBE17EA|nr:S53 family serine peptidase [Myxococcus sp. RHSTA-1-4]MBZ4422737.1 S53 family serine peptidase [Myxococcus sp. RHSTA-1-4]